jgi:hypothetical protein
VARTSLRLWSGVSALRPIERLITAAGAANASEYVFGFSVNRNPCRQIVMVFDRQGRKSVPDTREPTSFADNDFLDDRARFEGEFERFLTSLATPVESRRQRAIETVNRLGDIGRRAFSDG